ncbi:PLP-dependent aminotransferase family protein [Pseudoroseicyclus sp. CXY001]|uniref:aminotransferase-like domain-containing protein n=1 Tax=Pseudoroseicyclus sp. CXY001 TaxID=3242492 RepID=UPI00358DBD06
MPGARAKHQAIGLSIREAISGGELAAGDRLPPVRDVAWRLGVTPGTVARAYKDLVDQEVLVSGVGRGTFVAGAARPAYPPAGLPYMMVATPPDILNLSTAQVAHVGQGEVLHRLMLELPPPVGEDYVRYPVPEDDLVLRRFMAERSGGEDHGQIEADDVVLTAGAQQALVTALMTVLHGPRPVILTEELSYPGIRHAAALMRAEIRGVPLDDEGPLPEAFDRIAAETGAQVFVTSANAHNPTTIQTSRARREAVAEIVRARGMQILEDDCFGYAQAGLPGYRLLVPERAWVATSLSKAISPDLRLGALIGTPGRTIAARTAAQQQFFGIPRPVRELVMRAMETGAAEEIQARVKAKTQERVETTRAALGRFGIVTRDFVPFGWLPMPRGWRASSFLQAAERQCIRLKPADEFALIDGRAPNAVRLAFTAVAEDEAYAGALRRLAALLDKPVVTMEA